MLENIRYEKKIDDKEYSIVRIRYSKRLIIE